MIINMTGGGSGGKLFAAIGVVYSPGVACTCVNKAGTKSLAAKNTSGQWIFSIPALGEWTITAGAKSKTVEINSEGQCVLVNLKEVLLFDSASPAKWEGVQNYAGYGQSAINSAGSMAITGAYAASQGGLPRYYTYLRYYPELIKTTVPGTSLNVNVTKFVANAKLVLFNAVGDICSGGTYEDAETISETELTANGATLPLPIGNYYAGILVDGTGEIITPRVWIE